MSITPQIWQIFPKFPSTLVPFSQIRNHIINYVAEYFFVTNCMLLLSILWVLVGETPSRENGRQFAPDKLETIRRRRSNEDIKRDFSFNGQMSLICSSVNAQKARGNIIQLSSNDPSAHLRQIPIQDRSLTPFTVEDKVHSKFL